MEKTIYIQGMTCGHCKVNVEKALVTICGVKSVEVDLKPGRVCMSLNHEIDNNIFSSIISDLGYEIIEGN